MRDFEKSPIIIGGSPRSGTTLLISILSAHPDIYCVREEAWAFYDTDSLVEFETFIDEYLWHHIPDGAERTHRRWCEKTPRNVFAIDNLIKFFGPDLKFIHLVRDGRDVITSKHPHDPSRFWVGEEDWVWHVGEGLRYYNHPQVLTVRYEDIVLKFDATIKRVLEFTGDAMVESVLDWHRFSRIKEHSAWFGPAKPLNPANIGRWRKFQDSEIIRHFLANEDATRLLSELGYA
jgi:Sulfotransferase domain